VFDLTPSPEIVIWPTYPEPNQNSIIIIIIIVY